MTPEIQTMLTIGMPTLAVLIGILINNSRLSDMNARINDMNGRISDMNGRMGDMKGGIGDLRSHFDNRFDDLKETWRSELRRVEEVLDARLSHLEERLR